MADREIILDRYEEDYAVLEVSYNKDGKDIIGREVVEGSLLLGEPKEGDVLVMVDDKHYKADEEATIKRREEIRKKAFNLFLKQNNIKK